MAAKFPGANVAVVMPSRVEGCFACFDHFLGRTTASGEPLGYGARVRPTRPGPAFVNFGQVVRYLCQAGFAPIAVLACSGIRLAKM